MPIYLQKSNKNKSLSVWRIENGSAIRAAGPSSNPLQGAVYQCKPEQDVWDMFDENKYLFPNGREAFHLATLQPGEYHVRIARPSIAHLAGQHLVSPSAEHYKDALAIAKSQLSVLVRNLHHLCQTVHPGTSNLAVYGHQIRNLLILACTEVESHWKAVLLANGYSASRYSTNDYVKLEPAMKLGSYGVTFREYPWLKPFRPFAAWGLVGSPTQEIAWYDAYNHVKHDRESSFALATLQHAFDAVAASAVMVVAQFGFSEGLELCEAGDSLLFTEFPMWEPKDVYIPSVYGFPPVPNDEWKLVKRAF